MTFPSRWVTRSLVGVSLPLLLVAGVVLTADGGSPATEVVLQDASGSTGAGTGSADRTRAARAPRSTSSSTSSTTTAPPTAAPPVTEPPPTAPPTTSARVAPVTEPDPGPPPAPEPEPQPEPQPEPAPVDPGPPPVVSPPPAGGDVQTIVAHHNARRAEAGLAPLSFNSCMAGLATNWANYLASILGLLHQADLGGIVGNCLDWRSAGENVGYAALASDVADAFFASTLHRRNILDPSFTQIGVGVAYADGRIFVTVLFGG